MKPGSHSSARNCRRCRHNHGRRRCQPGPPTGRPAKPSAQHAAAKASARCMRVSTHRRFRTVGFAPVRPMDVVRATYDFAAQHPEILNYVPCYCGCGSQGHKANESCFVARRDPKGNVLEWDTHGFGCTICVDVAREAMQM